MIFQSLDFAVFLPVVFLAYWFATKGDIHRQNMVLLAASLFFYGWWDWRFMGLLLGGAVANFFMAIAIEGSEEKSRRSRMLWLGILSNLSLLFLFKYFNFFVLNFPRAFSILGMELPARSLDIALPLGISFYTFQALGYLIDVYRKRVPAVREWVVFLCFMTFFPKLTAGPIERASSLMPQFKLKRTFNEDMAVDGLRRVLLGLFMKLVVADNIDACIDHVFQYGGPKRGSTLFLGLLLRSMWVYADFAGYSEIAIGTASLLGFRLTRNFAFPFFATNLAMLWQRWHMTLTNWFRDYVFMVLPAKRSGRWVIVRNISVIYVLSGLWHGASWNYIAWGVSNALLIGFYLYFVHFPKRRLFKRKALGMVSTYVLFSLTMLPLTGGSLKHVMENVKGILSPDLFSQPYELLNRGALITLFFICALLAMEWVSREGEHGMAWIRNVGFRPLRWGVYIAMAISVLMFSGNRQPFIYLNF